MSNNSIRLLFLISSAYDFCIGLVFLVAGAVLLEWAHVPVPTQMAYLHFAALQLVIFGLMFLAIGWDPIANRNLIPFGMLLKACYVGIVIYYYSRGECPTLFQPFAVIDAIMLALFWSAHGSLNRKTSG